MDDFSDQSQVPSPQETTPTQNEDPTFSQKKTVRTVLIIFSVIFFAAIAILGFFAYTRSSEHSQKKIEEVTTTPQKVTLSPTETGPADWLTFVSEDFGISVKYPPGWEKKTGQSFENGDLFGVMIMGETQQPDTEWYDGASFTIANPITVDQDYQTWAKKYYTENHIDESEPLEFSTEEVNGIDYLKVYTCGLGCFTYYITEKNNYVYQIMITVDGPSESDYQKIVENMLSTIQLTEIETITMPSPPPGALSFFSQDLGIGFFYPQKAQNIQSVDVMEVGNKVYVFTTDTEPEDGQSVEVFSKNPDDSLSEAISQHFLAGKDENECYVTVIKTEGTITTAIIDFPDDQSNGLEGMFEKTTYCSEDYAKTNGIRYFWYDSKHPETYLFFSIGQYGIPVSSTENWQDTVKIIRMRE